MLNTVTHVSGPCVVIGKRVIQRCVICGDKLHDYNRDSNELQVWPEGVLISVDDGVARNMGDALDAQQLPIDSCIALVEW